MKKCPECLGTGSVQDGGTFSKFFRCDVCKGKRYLTKTKFLKYEKEISNARRYLDLEILAFFGKL